MAGIPDIVGTVGGLMDGVTYCDGAFNPDFISAAWDYTSNGGVYKAYFHASLSSTIYGNSTTVTPLSLSTKFFIKY